MKKSIIINLIEINGETRPMKPEEFAEELQDRMMGAAGYRRKPPIKLQAKPD